MAVMKELLADLLHIDDIAVLGQCTHARQPALRHCLGCVPCGRAGPAPA